MSGKGRCFLPVPVNDGGRVYVDGIAPEKQPTPGVAQKDSGIDGDRGRMSVSSVTFLASQTAQLTMSSCFSIV